MRLSVADLRASARLPGEGPFIGAAGGAGGPGGAAGAGGGLPAPPATGGGGGGGAGGGADAWARRGDGQADR